MPGPTDVLVRVEAVAVNPVDLFVRSGAYRTPTPFPFVLGRDMVGTVEEVGPGATGFAFGARMWSHSMGHGGRQGSPLSTAWSVSTGCTPLTAAARRFAPSVNRPSRRVSVAASAMASLSLSGMSIRPAPRSWTRSALKNWVRDTIRLHIGAV